VRAVVEARGSLTRWGSARDHLHPPARRRLSGRLYGWM